MSVGLMRILSDDVTPVVTSFFTDREALEYTKLSKLFHKVINDQHERKLSEEGIFKAQSSRKSFVLVYMKYPCLRKGHITCKFREVFEAEKKRLISIQEKFNQIDGYNVPTKIYNDFDIVDFPSYCQTEEQVESSLRHLQEQIDLNPNLKQAPVVIKLLVQGGLTYDQANAIINPNQNDSIENGKGYVYAAFSGLDYEEYFKQTDIALQLLLGRSDLNEEDVQELGPKRLSALIRCRDLTVQDVRIDSIFLGTICKYGPISREDFKSYKSSLILHDIILNHSNTSMCQVLKYNFEHLSWEFNIPNRNAGIIKQIEDSAWMIFHKVFINLNKPLDSWGVTFTDGEINVLREMFNLRGIDAIPKALIETNRE